MCRSPMFISSFLFFFFSSRRRHTRFDCDWSSDVCSSDLTSQDWSEECPQVLEHTVARDVRNALALNHFHGLGVADFARNHQHPSKEAGSNFFYLRNYLIGWQF